MRQYSIYIKSFYSNFTLISIYSHFFIKSYAYTVDLSNRDQIYECARRVKEDVGNVDILINNAGIVSGKNLFDCPDEMLERIMAVNSHSLFFVS